MENLQRSPLKQIDNTPKFTSPSDKDQINRDYSDKTVKLQSRDPCFQGARDSSHQEYQDQRFTPQSQGCTFGEYESLAPEVPKQLQNLEGCALALIQALFQVDAFNQQILNFNCIGEVSKEKEGHLKILLALQKLMVGLTKQDQHLINWSNIKTQLRKIDEFREVSDPMILLKILIKVLEDGLSLVKKPTNVRGKILEKDSGLVRKMFGKWEETLEFQDKGFKMVKVKEIQGEPLNLSEFKKDLKTSLQDGLGVKAQRSIWMLQSPYVLSIGLPSTVDSRKILESIMNPEKSEIVPVRLYLDSLSYENKDTIDELLVREKECLEESRKQELARLSKFGNTGAPLDHILEDVESILQNDAFMIGEELLNDEKQLEDVRKCIRFYKKAIMQRKETLEKNELDIDVEMFLKDKPKLGYQIHSVLIKKQNHGNGQDEYFTLVNDRGTKSWKLWNENFLKQFRWEDFWKTFNEDPAGQRLTVCCLFFVKEESQILGCDQKGLEQIKELLPPQVVQEVVFELKKEEARIMHLKAEQARKSELMIEINQIRDSFTNRRNQAWYEAADLKNHLKNINSTDLPKIPSFEGFLLLEPSGNKILEIHLLTEILNSYKTKDEEFMKMVLETFELGGITLRFTSEEKNEYERKKKRYLNVRVALGTIEKCFKYFLDRNLEEAIICAVFLRKLTIGFYSNEYLEHCEDFVHYLFNILKNFIVNRIPFFSRVAGFGLLKTLAYSETLAKARFSEIMERDIIEELEKLVSLFDEEEKEKFKDYVTTLKSKSFDEIKQEYEETFARKYYQLCKELEKNSENITDAELNEIYTRAQTTLMKYLDLNKFNSYYLQKVKAAKQNTKTSI